MINFVVDGTQFNFRAAAVIIDEGHVLLHRADFDTAWILPGGRVEAGEASAAAVVRELREELGPTIDANVGRMLWIVEYFWRYQGMPLHELGMYYLVTLGANSPLLAKDRAFDGVETDLPLHEGRPIRLIYQWFPLDALADMQLRPSFLRTRLSMPPATTELIIHTETDRF